MNSIEPDARRARGVFNQFGWHLHQGVEADGADSRLVSAHELHHDRLQATTAHGFLVHVVAALAAETGIARWVELRDGLQSMSYRVHEQFATWTSATTLGLDREGLVESLPGYLDYFDDVESLVEAARGPYLRMHLVHGLHRAAMQTDALRVALHRGVASLRLADFDRTRRPDWRMTLFGELDLAEFSNAVERRWAEDPRWRALQYGTLSETLYGPEFDDIWEDINRRAYKLACDLLEARGAPTLEYDGHIELTAPVLEEARAITGTRLGVRLEAEGPAMESIDIAVFSMEGETIVLRDAPLPAVVQGGSALDLIAGEEPLEHLYVSVRVPARLKAQWAIDDPAAIGDGDAVAVVRRTVLSEGGRVVELRPISGPAELEMSEVPIYGDISMAVLGEPASAKRWESLLGAENSVVLWDLQPTRHIRLWLDEPGHRLHYCVLNAERSGRTTMVLVARVISDTGQSRLFVGPASDLLVRALRAWLTETELGERSVLDRGLIEETDPMLQISLGHLLGEEMSFDFLAGKH